MLRQVQALVVGEVAAKHQVVESPNAHLARLRSAGKLTMATAALAAGFASPRGFANLDAAEGTAVSLSSDERTNGSAHADAPPKTRRRKGKAANGHAKEAEPPAAAPVAPTLPAPVYDEVYDEPAPVHEGTWEPPPPDAIRARLSGRDLCASSAV